MGISITQLFYGAFRDAGIVKTEQTILSPDQNEECRQLYNRFVDQLAADGFTVSHVARMLFPLVSNQGDYLVGPGGDFDMPVAPNQIERAGVLVTVTANAPYPEYRMQPLTLDEWQGWTLKTQTISYPRCFYYERSQPPLGTLHLVFVPTDANQIALYLEQPLSQIDATGDAELTYPNGYQMMIESNLAVQLAARYPNEQQMSEDTRANAIRSLALIKMNNDRPLKRELDWAVGDRRSNVYLGNRYQ